MTRWAIAAGDFTPLGGMDRANYALARYLAASGRYVHIVAHQVSPDLAAMSCVAVHEAARPLGSHLLGAPVLAWTARRVARTIGPARLLSNGGNTGWPGATWIHYLHAAYEPHASTFRSRVTATAGRHRYLAAEARTIDRAALVICNSKRTAADVAAHYPAAAARVRVAYYGVDASQFGDVTADERQAARTVCGLDASRPLAVFIGALGDRRKGFDLLFDAWRELCRDAAWDVDLAVVGAGDEAPVWRARAQRARMAERMTFLGFRVDVPRVLAAADMIVHPARYEAYGLGVHEALCRGLPAIVSARSGVAERLPEDLRPLTLPDPLNARDLVERLSTWRSDMDGWSQRVRAFAATLRARTWDHMAAEIGWMVEQAS